MGIEPGTRLGAYEVVGAIGAGGMGEVYRARDTKLGRDVALKVLPEEFSSDPERMGRFEREAKVLASLNHTNIAAIYGFEDSAGVHALAMELVEGPTLGDLIAMGPLRVEDALPIARQIAEGLEYAHERGIVHRDLKPANLKITPEGTAKILDFGLAKALEGETSAGNISSSPTMSRLATQAGIILGTAAYMAPEQAKGRPVDRRADIWAFGCVVYEMLTGKKPFDGETVTDVLAAVVRAEPDWSLLEGKAPAAVQKLLRRCLKKDAKQRLRDVGEARIALEEVLSGAVETEEKAAVAPARRSRREIVAWVLVAVLALVAVGVGAWAWHGLRAAKPMPAIAYIPPPQGTSFRFFGLDAGPVVVSPDGEELAFSATDQKGVTKIWVRPLASGKAKALAGTEDGSFPFWSGDGRSLGFFAGGKLKTVTVEDGNVQTVTDSACPTTWGAWSSRNVILFVAKCGGPIDRIPAGGGRPRPVAKPGLAAFPEFLPGGDKFLYLALGEDKQVSIHMASLSTGKSQIIMRDVGTPHSPAQFASGELLFLRDGKILAQRFDPASGKLSGDAKPLAKAYRFSVSAGGVLAFQGGTTDAHLEWFDRNGNPLGTIGKVRAWFAPSISPDGKEVVADAGNELDETQLWSYPAKGGVGTRLTFGPGPKMFAAWSPDGRYIAYSCRQGGVIAICRKPADGSGAEETLVKLGKDVQQANVLDWSPDGRYLSVDIMKDGQYGNWAFPLDGSRKPFQTAPSNGDQFGGYFSPDGHWLAYFSYETGRPEVFVVPFPGPGGKYQISQSGGWTKRWAGGDKLFFVSMGDRLMEADLATSGKSLRVKSIEPLFQLNLPVTTDPMFDVTPDGKRFLVVTSTDPAASHSISLMLDWPAMLRGR